MPRLTSFQCENIIVMLLGDVVLQHNMQMVGLKNNKVL